FPPCKWRRGEFHAAKPRLRPPLARATPAAAPGRSSSAPRPASRPHRRAGSFPDAAQAAGVACPVLADDQGRHDAFLLCRTCASSLAAWILLLGGCGDALRICRLRRGDVFAASTERSRACRDESSR